MSKDEKAMIVFFYFTSIFITMVFSYNFNWISDSDIYKAQAVCKKAGSKVSIIRSDGDFKCTNGATFDSDVKE